MSNMASFRQLLQPTWCPMYRSAFLWTTPGRPRGGTCCMGNSSFSSPTYPGFCALERTLQLRHASGVETTRRMAVTGYKSSSIGVGQDARGHSRRWERSSYLIGKLPPALSWAAPSQLGTTPPRSVSLVGVHEAEAKYRQADR